MKRIPTSLKVLGVLGGLTLAATLFAVPALATHTGPLDVPQTVSGNPKCDDYFDEGVNVEFVKFEPLSSGASTSYDLDDNGTNDGTIAYTINASNQLSFTITGPGVVGVAILKAGDHGPTSNIYDYNNYTGPGNSTNPQAAGGVTHDNRLVFPGGPSHVEFCIVRATALAVTTQSFRATRYGKSVVLRWRTASEYNTLGFNVFRTVRGQRVKLNNRLIPAASLINGRNVNAYSFRTRLASGRAAAAGRFWLQEVETNGARSWYGPVRAVAAT